MLLFCNPPFDRPPQQKILAALVHKKKAKNVSKGSTRMRIFRENMSLPEAKTWLHCRPCKPLRTLIIARQFTTWMKYYFPLFQTRTKCNRPQCAAIMDIYMEIIFCIVKGVSIESVDTMRKFGFCRPTSRSCR